MDQKKNKFLAVVNTSQKRNPVTGAMETINNSFVIEAIDASQALHIARVKMAELKLRERKFQGVKQLTFN